MFGARCSTVAMIALWSVWAQSGRKTRDIEFVDKVRTDMNQTFEFVFKFLLVVYSNIRLLLLSLKF